MGDAGAAAERAADVAQQPQRAQQGGRHWDDACTHRVVTSSCCWHQANGQCLCSRGRATGAAAVEAADRGLQAHRQVRISQISIPAPFHVFLCSPYSRIVRVGNSRMSTTARALTAAEAPRAEGAKPNQRERPNRPSPAGPEGHRWLGDWCGQASCAVHRDVGQHAVQGMQHAAHAHRHDTVVHRWRRQLSIRSTSLVSIVSTHHACKIGKSTSRSARASPPHRPPDTAAAAVGQQDRSRATWVQQLAGWQ